VNIHGAVVLVAVVEEAVGAPSARAVDLHVLRDPLLQAGHRHEDLEGRAGSQLGLDGLVHQGAVGVVDELVPVGAVDAHGEFIGIEAGPRNHGQNLAVAGVHGHDSAVAAAQRKFGGALQVVVDGEPQILAGLRVLDAQVAHLAAVTVHNHIP